MNCFRVVGPCAGVFGWLVQELVGEKWCVVAGFIDRKQADLYAGTKQEEVMKVENSDWD